MADIRDDAIPTDLPENIPESMRRKARALAQVKLGEARQRARQQLTRMTPKKSKRLEAQAIAKSKVEAVRRKVWRSIEDRGAGVPDYNQPSQVGPWDPYYAKRIPENKNPFTPTKNEGYNNPPFSIKEGARMDELELRAVSPDEADGVVASNAVDSG